MAKKNSAPEVKKGKTMKIKNIAEEEDEDNEDDESGADNQEDENDENDDDENDDDDNDDDEEEGSEVSEEKPRRKSKPANTNKSKSRKSKGGDDDDDDDDEESERSDERPKKKSKSSRSNSKASKVSKETSSNRKKKKPLTSGFKIPKSKIPTKLERLEEARKAYKWWEAPKLSAGIHWQHLEHCGIVFPPPYVMHHIPMLYDGKPVQLNSEEEEIVTFFAAMPLDGPQLGNAKTKPVFEKNFFEDFKESLRADQGIKSFEKCNFDQIREYLNLQKTLKKAANDEEKLLKKLEKEHIALRHGYALIDGRIEKMGNFNMEPPGLFRGRGEHPKTGKLKKRCFSESIALNVSEDSCVPICSLPGHAWESVRHDPTVTWLCSWNENVQNQNKYVMLAASSSFKGKSDMEKYTKAIRLKSHIGKVRQDYTTRIRSKDWGERQLGTAMWVIDILALRVGGEKGEDEADTVGCCSLRREHVTFHEDPETFELELEFLGKDSMLFKQTINFAMHGDLGKKVYENLIAFCKRKAPEAEIFETLSPQVLNKHLNSLMKGLSAKVFRTFNASVTLEKELPVASTLEGLSIQDKVLQYNAANRQVAILCNHQKTVSKATEVMFENLNEKLAKMKDQRNELIQWKDWEEKGKESKIPLKEDDKDDGDEVQEKILKATNRKSTAKSNEEKLAASAALDEAKVEMKQLQKRRFDEKHMFKSIPSATSLENRINKWTEEIRKLEVDIRNRDENKEVALGTSKINYMDPRISVAWCKRCEVPIDKIFAKTLRDKFNWAMAAPPDWKFE